MKKQFPILIALLLFFANVFASDKPVKAGDGSHVSLKIIRGGFSNPKSDDVHLMPQLTFVRTSENEGLEQEKLEKYKVVKMQAKLEFLAKNNSTTPNNFRTKSNEPTLLGGFTTTPKSDAFPSDNTLAINTNGQIVTVVNDHFNVYNTSGGSLQSTMALTSLFAPILSSGDIVCDPKVLYDNQANRFIIYSETCDGALFGGSSVPSKLCVAFSKSNDPISGWWTYALNGSPSTINSGNCWVDYPKMAVSNADLFITSNMFDGSGNYLEAVVYQINKHVGYNGNTFTSANAIIWDSLTNSPFTLVPVGNGISGGYGNQMYLVSSSNSMGNSSQLNLYTISDSVGSNPTMSYNSVAIPSYSTAADAVQKGTSVQLKTGDDRGMDGFYLNGTIHFVFHCDPSTNFCSINYSRITFNGSNWVAQNTIIAPAANTDYAYPAIASAGYNNNDQSAMIVYNYASANEYPSTAAVFVDNNFNVSNPVNIFSGTGPVDDNGYVQANKIRQGDYCGAARDYSSNPPTVYFYSTYGDNSTDWENYVSSLQTVAAAPLGITSESKIESKVVVFPNPVVDEVNIKFSATQNEIIHINLFDIQGKMVKEIYTTNCHQGENIFSFNKGALDAGSYILQISSNNQIIKNEKNIVAQK